MVVASFSREVLLFHLVLDVVLFYQNTWSLLKTANYVPAPVNVNDDCSALALMAVNEFSRLLTRAALVRPVR